MRRLLLTIALVLAALGALAGPAQADFGLSEFDVTFTGPKGETESQAGSHPFQMTTALHVISFPEGPTEAAEESVRDVFVSQMPGFVGNPTAVKPCATVDFLRTVDVEVPGEGAVPMPECPSSSAIGVAKVELSAPLGGLLPAYGAIYNLTPPPGAPAKLGFWVDGVPVTLQLNVSETAPYEIVGGPTAISQVLEVITSELTLWGVPASHAHDALRGHCLNPGLGTSLGNCEAGVAEVPFLTLPRSCEGPLTTSYAVDSWPHPGTWLENGEPDLADPAWVTGSATTHDAFGNPRGMEGCEKLTFEPEVSVRPSTESAETASGLDIEIGVHDEGLVNPKGTSQADIRATEFAFPAGMTANPSAAEGLGICTTAQYAAESRGHHGCPEGAKLGSLEVETPILENHVLRGSVFLAAPYENPFGSLLAAYLVIRDPELGVFVKLPSEIRTNEETGQLVASVEEMPPFPLSHVAVHLRSGPRAPFVTPPSCGNYSSAVALTPSSGAAPQQSEPGFQISSGPGGGACPAGLSPFAPVLQAGSQSNAAGAYSPFSMRITRNDGEQDITRFSATLPPGEVAKIAGVPQCSDAAIEAAKLRTGKQELASPSCPASSQIGTVVGGAGVGTALTYVKGSLYLAGPYNGDQLSVVSIVPAVAGPFDVGTVVTRVALALDPETGEAQVDGAASDPIPHILKGIPLKLRDLRIYVDRPEFTLNPTSCNPFSTRAQIGGSGLNPFVSSDDTTASASARFQASSCASLDFRPNLKLALRGSTKRGGHPQLRSVVTYPQGPGYANIGRAVVVLPHSEFISPEKVGDTCTRPQFAADECPPSTRLGFAKAWTPLLDKPLEGPVYFRANGGVRDIPDVVADLGGQFNVVLLGAVDSVDTKRAGGSKAKIRTTFAQVPDAPVSRFELTLKGGGEGVIENSANLCAAKRYVQVNLTGQNGRRHNFRTPLDVQCGRSGRSK